MKTAVIALMNLLPKILKEAVTKDENFGLVGISLGLVVVIPVVLFLLRSEVFLYSKSTITQGNKDGIEFNESCVGSERNTKSAISCPNNYGQIISIRYMLSARYRLK